MNTKISALDPIVSSSNLQRALTIDTSMQYSRIHVSDIKQYVILPTTRAAPWFLFEFLRKLAFVIKCSRGPYLYRCEELRNCSFATKLFHLTFLYSSVDEFRYSTDIFRRTLPHIFVSNS
jgi:hypothetical protein